MQRVTFELPKQKKNTTTKLWALAEEAAIITGTQPKRWLRAGVFTLEKALIDYKELKATARKPAAYFTWLVKKHTV